MSVHFKNIRWKNLLSTGNHSTSIPLDAHNSTLIVGDNGAGKSTLLDALSYVLFGKPFRKINLPQLINSINGKGLLVEVEFLTGDHEYRIVRGLKPAMFHIFKDGELINQNAEAKEYQAHLEKNILHMNKKTFNQIVVLGSSTFTPFMQLRPYDRRDVIENLLDLKIFSVMSTLLKELVVETKDDLYRCSSDLTLISEKVTIHGEYIKKLKKQREESADSRAEEVQEKNVLILELQDKGQKEKEKVYAYQSVIKDEDTQHTVLEKMKSIQTQLATKIASDKKKIAFIENNDHCPECEHEFEPEFKQKRIEERQISLGKKSSNMEQVDDKINDIQDRLTEIHAVQVEISKHQETITLLGAEIQSLQMVIANIQKETGTTGADDEEEIKGLVAALEADRYDLLKQKKNLLEYMEILGIATRLLKDDGIKSKIIRQYVPIINKLINKYLAAMDFFVKFELDETFNETIKSRHRDVFSYPSFSEGEKQRIDLALLFTWRAIAKLKNSSSTNLLLLDEIFDSSLDAAGTEEFLKIIGDFAEDNNIFIISHKTDQIADKFSNVIQFEKIQNFSRATEK